MSDDQAIEISEALITLLRRSDLDWIVNEVQSAVSEGKTETKELEREPHEQRQRGRRRRATIGHAQRQWTPEERLALLLDATEAALCGPAFMQSELIVVVPEWQNHLLEFGTDRIRGEQYSVSLDGSVMDRLAIARRLSTVLERARRELNVDLD